MDITGIFSESFWWVAPVISAATVLLAGVVNGLLKIEKGVWPQVVAWVLASGLSVGAYFAGLVEMGDPQWLGVVALCAVTGLSSNGIYDIPTIKAWVDAWFAKKPTLKQKKVQG